MDEPLVTVVIPTRDRLPMLRQAVASVVAQTYPRWELVVADHGSTDGTAAWLAEMDDPRVRSIPTDPARHVGHVRNRGAAMGTGDWIAFLDSDDVWLPRKLELQVAAMRGSPARWCYAGYELMDGAGRTVPMRLGEYRPLSGRIAREVVAQQANVFVGTLLVERRLFEELGGFCEDERARGREDYELEMRLALHAEALALPDVLARVRDHPGRMTARMPDTYEREAAAYELFLEAGPPEELARLARAMRSRSLVEALGRRMTGTASHPDVAAARG
ncbi:MAG TPA: glycosyltransferase family A protein [Longimicrobium sp.]